MLPQSIKRTTQLVLIGAVIALSTGAGNTTGRFDKLSHQLMCACGCSQLLGECNHVGCPDSTAMRAKLMTAVDHGDPDKTILLGFPGGVRSHLSRRSPLHRLQPRCLDPAAAYPHPWTGTGRLHRTSLETQASQHPGPAKAVFTNRVQLRTRSHPARNRVLIA